MANVEDYIQLPESLVASTRFHFRRWLPILILAVIVGVVGGGVAIVFKWFVDIFTFFFFDILLPASPLKNGNLNFTYILLPALGGLAIGPILDKWAPEVFGTGIPEVMESVVMQGGVIKKRTGIMRILGASLTIGTGGSGGMFAPTLVIGSFLEELLG